MAFTTCSDAAVGNITRSGDAIRHSWNECRSDQFVIPGYGEIFVTGVARFWLAPHPDFGTLCALDCDGDPVQMGDSYEAAACLGLGLHPYQVVRDLPCEKWPEERVLNKTWGDIKAMFGN